MLSVSLSLSSFLSADSPLLWIRIDPDMSILRKVEFEQADFMWQYQLRYERDVVAQVGSWQEFSVTLQHFHMHTSAEKICSEKLDWEELASSFYIILIR